MRPPYPLPPDYPMGYELIALHCGVGYLTPQQWKARHLLPEPTYPMPGKPVWSAEVIREFCERTGRRFYEDPTTQNIGWNTKPPRTTRRS